MTRYAVKITLDITDSFRDQVIETAGPVLGGFLEEHGTDLGAYDPTTWSRFLHTMFDVMGIAVLQKQVMVHAPVVEDGVDDATIGL